MCPKDDPMNYLNIIGLLVLAVGFAFGMYRLILMVKARLRARNQKLLGEESILDVMHLGRPI